MKKKFLFVLLWLACFSCQPTESNKNTGNEQQAPDGEVLFDKAKWKIKDGADYPYRANMLNAVVFNDSVRALHRAEILDLLGEPDRSNENYLYYLIAQKRLGLWPLSTKTMVIKFTDDDTIDWIKIHE